MTVRRTTTTDARDRANANLNAAIRRTGGTTPCLLNPDWTADVRTPLSALDARLTIDLVDTCDFECPVLVECRALAAASPARLKAGTVTAGVRYDAAGRPVDLTAERDRINRDQRLTDAAERAA